MQRYTCNKATCEEKNIGLIEDAAHAPGATIEGRSCGTVGDIGCFSFFSNKNLSIGEGGMVVTSDDELHQRLGFLRSHGMTSLTLDRHKGRATTYDVALSGLNYRLDEMRSALGSVQLEKLAAGNAKRRSLTDRYRNNLQKSGILMPFADQPSDSTSAYHILPVLLPTGTDRYAVMNAMKDRKIQTSIHYPPFWDFAAYSGVFSSSDFPFTADICARQLTLPLYPTMQTEQVDTVCDALMEILQ